MQRLKKVFLFILGIVFIPVILRKFLSWIVRCEDYRGIVCSPNQMMRKMLCYIDFGYFPNIHTVSSEKMYHNPINEIFECIPKVLENNQEYQDEIRDNRRVKIRKGKP